LKNGADINAENCKGITALMFASLKGHSETVEILLKNGAGVNMKDTHGRSAIMFASLQGHTKTVDMLRSNGADDERVADGKSNTMYASLVCQTF
jgi:serine/threonine-protein phosphatase 6 regulatory ankyrin repeat subunit B